MEKENNVLYLEENENDDEISDEKDNDEHIDIQNKFDMKDKDEDDIDGNDNDNKKEIEMKDFQFEKQKNEEKLDDAESGEDTDKEEEVNIQEMSTKSGIVEPELTFDIENDNDNDNDNDNYTDTDNESYNKGQSFCYKKIGKTFSFFGDKDGNPLLMIGPQWPMYIFLSGLVVGVITVFLCFFWEIFGYKYKIVGIILMIFFELTYTYTFVINPGFPLNDNERKHGEPREDFTFCTECKFWVNIHRKVNHCYDCGICVEGYDHHCPWTSKCIGKKNLYSFYMFMAGILLIFGYFIYGLIEGSAD